jgi:hypothetical protein
MKKILHFVLLLGMLAGGLLAIGSPANAQVYPYSSPTYTPNARMPAMTIASGVASTTQTLNNVGVAALQITGTCTSLNGRLEASVDGTNWVTLNLYPYNATAAASAVTSVTGTGAWVANTGGYNNIRVNNSAVSGTACVANMSGSSMDFTLPR